MDLFVLFISSMSIVPWAFSKIVWIDTDRNVKKKKKRQDKTKKRWLIGGCILSFSFDLLDFPLLHDPATIECIGVIIDNNVKS